jgi:pilus assembly protein CpaC
MWKVVVLALCMFAGRAFCEETPPAPAESYPSFEERKRLNDEALVKDAVRLANLQTATVLLKVSLIEIPVTKLRRLGMDFSSAAVSNAAAAAKPQPAKKEVSLFSDWNPISSGCLLVKEDDARISVIKALVADHLAKIVAQPVLVTENGRGVSFNCGGEFPVPVPQSLGTVTIEWKKHGLRVDSVPTVLDQDSINLQIRVGLSELDESRSIRVGETTIPSLKILTDMEATFKIKTGQVAVVSGGTRTVAVHEHAESAKKK